MPDTQPTTPEGQGTQVLKVYGPCAVLRTYLDRHVHIEPTAAIDVRLLNLGPSHMLLESVTTMWLEGRQERTLYVPLNQMVDPGNGVLAMTIKSIENILESVGKPAQIGRPAMSHAYRMTFRVAVPGELMTIDLLFKPMTVGTGGSTYFGVIPDPGP